MMKYRTMTRTWMWAAFCGVVTLVMAGCTHDEEQLSASRAIALSPYTVSTDDGTRADKDLLADQGIPDGQHIGIYAYYHQQATWATDGSHVPNFMFNQLATYNAMNDAFTYSPLKYWPNTETDKLSFIAYYPYGTSDNGITPTLANTDSGLPTFDVTVKDDVTRQVDFLVSDLMADLPRSRDTEDDPGVPFNDLTIQDRVRLHFRHALSKVTFRVVINDTIRKDVAHFKLHELRMSNLYKEGSLATTYDAATKETDLQWTQRGAKTNYDINPQETYLLMPQALGDDVTLYINYSIAYKSEDGTVFIYDEDGKPVPVDTYTYSQKATLKMNTFVQTGTTTAIAEWLPHHHYVYTIRIGGRRIDFTAQVVEWGDYQPIEVIPE